MSQFDFFFFFLGEKLDEIPHYSHRPFCFFLFNLCIHPANAMGILTSHHMPGIGWCWGYTGDWTDTVLWGHAGDWIRHGSCPRQADDSQANEGTGKDSGGALWSSHLLFPHCFHHFILPCCGCPLGPGPGCPVLLSPSLGNGSPLRAPRHSFYWLPRCLLRPTRPGATGQVLDSIGTQTKHLQSRNLMSLCVTSLPPGSLCLGERHDLGPLAHPHSSFSLSQQIQSA